VEARQGISEPLISPYTAGDVAEILASHGWLATPLQAGDAAVDEWLARAAQLLGPHAADRDALFSLLQLIFCYNATEIARRPDTHAVLVREGARAVLRALAHQVLSGGAVDSDRYKEIITSLKAAVPHRGRSLFFPIRLALAGRPGDGELDRVILLLDSASLLPFAAPVKSTRTRILEFCSALD